MHLLKTANRKLSSRRTKSKPYFSPYVRPGWRIPSFTVVPDNLPALDGFEVGEAIGNQRQIIPAI
jgi:hypothetical protein